MGHTPLQDLFTALLLTSQVSLPFTLTLSHSTQATQLPCYSRDTSRHTLPWAFSLLSSSWKTSPSDISKWLTSSPSFLKPCGMNGRGCSEKTPNGHFLMDVPQACPTRTSSSPSTLKLLLLMWSSSQGVALFHTSLLLTWHSSCAIDYYVLCPLNMSPNHSPLLTLLHSLSPSYHGLPLHYWYGLSTGLHISNLPPHPPTRFLHPASIFQVDWSPL